MTKFLGLRAAVLGCLGLWGAAAIAGGWTSEAASQNQDAKALGFLQSVNAALQSSQTDKVQALFAYPKVDSVYLLAMAKRRSGLAKLHAAMIPAPPGWAQRGPYWVVIHTFQDIEEDHDPVYEAIPTQDGFQLGHEVREDDLAGWAIVHSDYRAELHPADHKVDVDVKVSLAKGSAERAPVFRLNDVYIPVGAVMATEDVIPKPALGSVVRAGSLLIPWTDKPALKYEFKYSGVLQTANEDKIDTKVAYVTAWWLPSLGRLPFTVNGTIVGSDKWTLRGEGIQVGRADANGLQTTSFACDLPISYPKVIGGLYRLAAQKTVNGQDFKIFQLDPVESSRAEVDLQAMIDAAAFYQSFLGPLPFPGYECYDADTYYGIESYSHTLLQRRITHFISHEMGHSYFGGIVPCPYVHDSWNEGVTEYVDSVLLLHDADGSLEAALQGLNVNVPLTEMEVPHAYDGQSYWRGCYVMKMLEAEIGPDKVKNALTLMVKERKGLDTRWRDLRQYFERAGGKPLEWFWSQWVEGSQFPTLTVAEVDPIQREKTYRVYVKVRQSGTPQPFRMKFAIEYTVKGAKNQVMCDLDTASNDFSFDVDSLPDDVQLKVFPYTLARAVQYKIPRQN